MGAGKQFHLLLWLNLPSSRVLHLSVGGCRRCGGWLLGVGSSCVCRGLTLLVILHRHRHGQQAGGMQSMSIYPPAAVEKAWLTANSEVAWELDMGASAGCALAKGLVQCCWRVGVLAYVTCTALLL